jgi:hypothetical protein
LALGKTFKITCATIALSLLLTGCAPLDGAQNTGNSKISGSPMPTTALNYHGELLLGKTHVDREFLQEALSSCKHAQTDGFILSYDEGISIFRPAATGIFPDWPFDEVSVVNGQAGGAFFNNDLPAFFSACNLELMAQRVEAGSPLLEYKVVRNSSDSYTWYQHSGGNDMTGITYEFIAGQISSYEVNGSKFTVSYGPITEDQQKLFD